MKACERGTFFLFKVREGVTFSVKMVTVYKRVRGWSSGRSLPVLNFVEYLSPPLYLIDLIRSSARICPWIRKGLKFE